jgi:hypothetical protein
MKARPMPRPFKMHLKFVVVNNFCRAEIFLNNPDACAVTFSRFQIILRRRKISTRLPLSFRVTTDTAASDARMVYLDDAKKGIEVREQVGEIAIGPSELKTYQAARSHAVL